MQALVTLRNTPRIHARRSGETTSPIRHTDATGNSERKNSIKGAVAGGALLTGLLLFSTLSEEDKASLGQYFMAIPWGILNGVIALLSLKEFLTEAASINRNPLQAKKIALVTMAFALFCFDVCAVISDLPKLGYNLSTGENTKIGDMTNSINKYNPIVLLMTHLIKAGIDERPLKQLMRDSLLFIWQNLVSFEINRNIDFLSLNGINTDQVERTHNALCRFLSTPRGDAFFNILMQVITLLSQLPEQARRGEERANSQLINYQPLPQTPFVIIQVQN